MDLHTGMQDKTISERSAKRHWNMIATYLVIYDVLAVNAAYAFGLFLRFDFAFSKIEAGYWEAFVRFAPVYTVLCIAVFYACRLYHSIWQYASYHELHRIIIASAVTVFLHTAGITLFVKRMPISYYMIGAVMQLMLLVLPRFGYRFVALERTKISNQKTEKQRVMVIGAGSAGHILVRELNHTALSEGRACCIIDDDARKTGMYMEGVPVVGGRDSIFENVNAYQIELILFAIPTASMETRREILNICKETGCEIKILPGVYQVANGEVLMSKIRPVAVEDLLGREQVKVDIDSICQYIQGKVVLITGGGGSIGSELARQIAGHAPKQLILFDIYENNAYDIEQELRKKHPELDLQVLIGSVRDSRRVDWLFATYRPQIVYHAAAHKHVPLMEMSPNEAIKNNVVGTYKTAYAALKYHTERFVLISTDKAVNPTNIMGASKRICEMIIQSMDMISRENRMDLLPFLHAHVDAYDEAHLTQPSGADARQELAWIGEMHSEKSNGSRTEFVAVRFGNVLGSNGSVIPLFKKQIAAGGPVTVTHPDIIRYFMTIPEAVSLVLQAGTLAWGGEIFVLDMGEPVKIDTLARNLIKLSGYKPDEDIQVVYTGLRPGEKLYEEKLMTEEGLKKTDNALIHIGKPVPFNIEHFLGQLEKLAAASYENDAHIVEMVEEIVTTFHPVTNKKEAS